jgi:carbon storage regulator
MLVLSRQKDESIMIGDGIRITIVDVRGEKVRLGIEAPKDVKVFRSELYEEILSQNREALQPKAEDVDKLKDLLK